MEKYARQRKIGEGAFGKAILVKKKEDGRQYVIKEINITRMSPKERQDSKKEVAVLAQLHHPNIVHYRESFEEAGSLYIVMDFCEKGDLYSKINSQRGILFPEEQVIDWFVQICLAIKHIHDRKILHRDIKSQNIFVSADGSVKLGDFGIAKVLGSTAELARTCIGTPYYLSPEICENRPYNNKSDIWSLGCVLYELATLKHAFEAGNMKNLVLKIIRGSYPPISPKYSYDLRGLIAQLFKRSPKDRPSINSVLKKPFIQRRVSKFLTDDEIASEFSHTVMHGQKISRALPPPPPASRPPAVRKATPARPQQRYNPANIYGAPVARKSKDNRSSQEKNRPGSANSRPNSARSRPGSAGGAKPVNSSQDLKKKRQELVEKERKRQEEENKAAVEKKHKEILDKQKMARINKAREEGWKNMVDSLGSGDGDSKNGDKGQKDQIKWPPPSPRVPPGEPNISAQDRGKYDQYHAYLDKIQRNQGERKRQDLQQQGKPAAAYMAAPRVANPPQPIPNWNRPGAKPPPGTPAYSKPDQGIRKPEARANDKAAIAAERARIVDEFIARKREAALNRQRGHFDIFGNPVGGESPARKPQDVQDDSPPSSAREREEKEYLERLKQIRQNNYIDRKNVHEKQRKDEAAKQDADMRKKKIEALRQQADDRAKMLRQQLDKQRREMFDLERKLKDKQGKQQDGNRPVPAPRPVVIKPAPAASITGALNAIGAEPPKPQPHPDAAPAVGMTGVLDAIGAKSKTPEPVAREKSNLQKQKEEILKRLNQKGDPRGKWGAPGKPAVKEETSVPESARSKWGEGKPAIKEETAVPDSARSKWGEGDEIKLGDLPLEQTASQMEVTSARDQVVKHPLTDEEKDAAAAAAAVARRQWGRPSSTVVRALKDAPIKEGTMSSEKSDDSTEASVTTPEDPPKAIGSTVTITKPSIQKGTIVIKGAEGSEKEDHTKQIGATITLDKPVICKGPAILSSVLENSDKPETPTEQSQSEGPAKDTPNQNSEPIKEEAQTAQSKPSADVSQSQSSEQSEEVSEKSQTENEKETDSNKPPVPARPAVTSKPLVLPKPVLLKKPDAPFGSSGAVTEAVNTEGVGSLFEKVEPKVKDEEGKPSTTAQKDETVVKETVAKTTKKKLEKQSSGLILGLTAGQFDIGNAQMLRTCSEPDLSKLSQTSEKNTVLSGTRRQSCDDLDKLRDEDEAMVANMLANVLLDESDNDESEDISDQIKLSLDDKSEDKSQSPRDSSKEGDDADVEEQDDDIDDDDYEDLLSVRETMQSLLLCEGCTDDDGKDTGKFRLSSSREINIQEEDPNDEGVNDLKDNKDKNNDKENEKKEGEIEDVEDFDEEDDVNEEGNDDDVENSKDDDEVENEENGEEDENFVARSFSVDSENVSDPASDLFQSDESDVDTQFGDDEENYDLFSRLEESRAELETELGCDKFLKVYKTVQALQEDEDENIEEGAKLVTKILGQEKEHLYPKIFQLVMADAAFTEDNS